MPWRAFVPSGLETSVAHDLLHGTRPERIPEQIVEEAERLAECACALYVVALEGSLLLRATESEALPERLTIPQTLGPEIPRQAGDTVAAGVKRQVPGGWTEPLWIGGRAFTVLVGTSAPAEPLDALLMTGAAAVEMAHRMTDRFDRARRTRRTTAAAELQQSLLPPPAGSFGGVDLAASILPAYEVGGDWYDWAQNRGELEFSVADGIGKGSPAMALSAVALSALRAARRGCEGLAASALAMDRAIHELPGPVQFVTAVLARWLAPERAVEWVVFGHPAPMRVSAAGDAVELAGHLHPPLGVLAPGTEPVVNRCALTAGDQFVLYTDGVTERRRPDGSHFGRAGIIAAVAAAEDRTAAATVRAVERAVSEASGEPPRDDATLLVIAAVE